MRSFSLKWHRNLGLVIGFFIFIAGLTGSIISFYHPLDRMINPWQVSSVPSFETTLSDPLIHIREIEQKIEGAKVSWVSLSLKHQSSWLYFLEEIKPKKHIAFNEVYINPYTSQITGMRLWGDITQGVSNLLPFIYKLHYALALGPFGAGIMGIAAFFWLLILMSGIWITLPKWNNISSLKSFFMKWSKVWKWRFKGNFHAKNYHWHKTGGLWLLVFMFILAWSSVAFNLPALHQKIVGTDSFQQDHLKIKELRRLLINPKIDWIEARLIARELMSKLAKKEGFVINEESSLAYEIHQGVYIYSVSSTLDISKEHGSTKVYFDANTGAQKAFFLPTGKKKGDTLTQWLLALHTGNLWGMPHKIVLCFLGVITTLLVLSGSYLWWKRRVIRS